MSARAIHADPIAALWRARPRSRLLRLSVLALGALVAWAWTSGEVSPGAVLDPRRIANLGRFLGEELAPHALRGEPFSPRALLGWAAEVFGERGRAALLTTFLMSVLAIALAGALSWVLAALGSRNVASPSPFGAGDAARASIAARAGWGLARLAARGAMIFLRAIPEYVIAFLLLAVLGPATAWPAVLALALHNGGILGRLGAEVVEDLDPAPLRSLRAIGARRRAILGSAVLPLALGRYLLFFFYRYETCVREATVLGMLGVVSLGYWIQDARSKHFYDEMLLFVAAGGALVLAADALSALVRRYLRARV